MKCDESYIYTTGLVKREYVLNLLIYAPDPSVEQCLEWSCCVNSQYRLEAKMYHFLLTFAGLQLVAGNVVFMHVCVCAAMNA